MKKIFNLLLCAVALFSVVSCDKDDEVTNDEVTNNDDSQNDDSTNDDSQASTLSFLYILNSGSYGSNNASITSYDYETSSTVDCIFATQNGQGLGDTAQDMLVFGDKIFITMYGSGVIFVTDLEGNIVNQITDATYYLPRYLTSDSEYVYVSYYDGGVAKINPETYEMTTAAVSINPEKLVEVDGSLYITISQGYGNYNDCNTIDVYDTATMTYTKSIEVILNPTSITADSFGNLYVISMGNYGYGDTAIYATLQKVDTDGNVSIIDVTDIEDATPTMMTMGADDKLYVVEGVSNASTGWAMVGDIYSYDTTTGEIETFITDGTTISNIYSISADKATGELFVGTSDYINTGDVYVLNGDGTLKNIVGVGMNPMMATVVEYADAE